MKTIRIYADAFDPNNVDTTEFEAYCELFGMDPTDDESWAVYERDVEMMNRTVEDDMVMPSDDYHYDYA